MPLRLIIALLFSLALHASLLSMDLLKPFPSAPAPRLQALLRLPPEPIKPPEQPPLPTTDPLLKNTIEPSPNTTAPKPKPSPTPPARNNRKAPSKESVARQEIQTVQKKLSQYVFYPEQARMQGLEGTVRLFVELADDGRVLDVRVIGSTGYPVLDNAAIKGFYAVGRFPGGSDIWDYTFQLED